MSRIEQRWSSRSLQLLLSTAATSPMAILQRTRDDGSNESARWANQSDGCGPSEWRLHVMEETLNVDVCACRKSMSRPTPKKDRRISSIPPQVTTKMIPCVPLSWPPPPPIVLIARTTTKRFRSKHPIWWRTTHCYSKCPPRWPHPMIKSRTQY